MSNTPLVNRVKGPIMEDNSVADFWDANSCSVWSRFQRLLPPGHKNKIATIFLLTNGNVKDTIAWSSTPSGQFFAKIAHFSVGILGLEDIYGF